MILSLEGRQPNSSSKLKRFFLFPYTLNSCNYFRIYFSLWIGARECIWLSEKLLYNWWFDSYNLCCFTEESRCKTRPPYFSIKWWIKKIFTYRFPRIRSGVSHDTFVMMTWCTHDASHDAFLSQPANFDVSKAIILTLVSILSSRIRCRTNL